MTSVLRFGLAISAPAVLAVSQVAWSATVVWADNFDQVGRTTINDYSYVVPTGTDYAFTATQNMDSNYAANQTVGVSGGVMVLSDAHNSSYSQVLVSSSRWAPVTYVAGDTLTLALDINVTSYVHGSTSAAVPRLSFNVGGAGAFTLGYGRGAADTDDGDDLFFYATTSALNVPGASNALGLDGSGGWVNGFDFGNYNAEVGSDNATGGFYRLEATFTQGGSTVNSTLTRLDADGAVTGDAVNFMVQLTGAANFNSASSFYLTTGSASVTTTWLDNISVTVNQVPEPARAMLGLIGIVISGCHRRRRSAMA
jgi:hypothetical protein